MNDEHGLGYKAEGSTLWDIAIVLDSSSDEAHVC